MAWYKFYNYCYIGSVQTIAKTLFLQSMPEANEH